LIDRQGGTQGVRELTPPMDLSNGTQAITIVIPQIIGIQHGEQRVTQETSPLKSSYVFPHTTPPLGTPRTKGRIDPLSSRYHGNGSSRKTRRLKEIYETSMDEDDDNELVNCSLFSLSYAIYFEDAVKERKIRDSIDKEMKAVEKNDM